MRERKQRRDGGRESGREEERESGRNRGMEKDGREEDKVSVCVFTLRVLTISPSVGLQAYELGRNIKRRP